MRAARVEDGAVHIRDVPVPVPGEEEALIRISTAGVCHDLGMKLLRKGGLFVAVGLPATREGNFELDPFELFMKDPTCPTGGPVVGKGDPVGRRVAM